MKLFGRLLGVVALAIILLTSGCGNDDPKPQSLLVGTWSITDVDSEFTMGGLSIVDYLVTQGFDLEIAQYYSGELMAEITPVDLRGTVEFKADGSYSANDGSSTSTGTWQISDNQQTLTLDQGTADEATMQVKVLTSTNLELELAVEESVQMPVVLKFSALMKFARK